MTIEPVVDGTIYLMLLFPFMLWAFAPLLGDNDAESSLHTQAPGRDVSTESAGSVSFTGADRTGDGAGVAQRASTQTEE